MGMYLAGSSFGSLLLAGAVGALLASAPGSRAFAQGIEGLDAPPSPAGDAPVPAFAPTYEPAAPAEEFTEPESSPYQPDSVPPPPPASGSYDSAAGGSYRSRADGPNLSIPSRVATRLRVLDADFAYLAGRGGSRIVDGVLSIVTGGLSITLGIIIKTENLSEYLYLYGGAGVARGIIDLVLDPNTSDAAVEYSHMPMGTLEQAEERLRFGESELESIADMSRLSRILDASINIAAGAAFVPLYLGPNDFEIDTFGAIVLVTAGVSVVTGVINLFTRSEAERRWSAYEELRDRLTASAAGDSADNDALEGAQRRRAGLEVDFSFAATPDGGGVGAVGRF